MASGDSRTSRQFQVPAWVKTLAAPLFVISLLAHGLLLVIPVTSSSTPELEEEVSEEEEFVDLLSISSIAAPEPEPEPDIPTTSPPEAASPPPAAAAPTAPTQPTVPEVFPDTPLEDVAPDEVSPPAEANFTPPPEQTGTAAPPSEEVAAMANRLTRGQGINFDITEISFPNAAYDTQGGIGEWSAQEQSCFFTQVSNSSYETKPNISSLRYWSRNVGLIQQQDLPNSFPAPEYQITDLGGYCDRPLFQVSRGSEDSLFVSIVGIGVGNPQSTGLVIFWSSDPRLG